MMFPVLPASASHMALPIRKQVILPRAKQPMSAVDFDLLRGRIAEAVAHTFRAVRAAHPTDSIYAFALYTVEDAIGVNPSVNSEEAYRRTVVRETAEEVKTKWLESNGISLEGFLLGDHRWSAPAWEYDCDESEGFDLVNELINNDGTGVYDEEDALGFEKFKAGVLASMLLGLQDVITAGRFGAGAGMSSLTFFCSIADSEDAIWFEEDSARRLNSAASFKAFVEERIKYIADGEAPSPVDPESVQGLYLTRMKAAGTR
jgi:uncharacterized protein DUF4303